MGVRIELLVCVLCAACCFSCFDVLSFVCAGDEMNGEEDFDEGYDSEGEEKHDAVLGVECVGGCLMTILPYGRYS